jgi:hypothetical protein
MDCDPVRGLSSTIVATVRVAIVRKYQRASDNEMSELTFCSSQDIVRLITSLIKLQGKLVLEMKSTYRFQT